MLSLMLLILIVGTIGAYYIWRVQEVLIIGGAVAVSLAAALLEAIKKFRW